MTLGNTIIRKLRAPFFSTIRRGPDGKAVSSSVHPHHQTFVAVARFSVECRYTTLRTAAHAGSFSARVHVRTRGRAPLSDCYMYDTGSTKTLRYIGP